MKTLRTLNAAAFATALLAATACGGSSDSPSATVPADVGLEVIAGPGIKFDAASYSATAGTIKVAYVNRDSQRHTLVLRDSEGVQLPGKLEVAKGGDVVTGEFTLQPGTYAVFCDVPGHQAMKAELVVK